MLVRNATGVVDVVRQGTVGTRAPSEHSVGHSGGKDAAIAANAAIAAIASSVAAAAVAVVRKVGRGRRLSRRLHIRISSSRLQTIRNSTGRAMGGIRTCGTLLSSILPAIAGAPNQVVRIFAGFDASVLGVGEAIEGRDFEKASAPGVWSRHVGQRMRHAADEPMVQLSLAEQRMVWKWSVVSIAESTRLRCGSWSAARTRRVRRSIFNTNQRLRGSRVVRPPTRLEARQPVRSSRGRWLRGSGAVLWVVGGALGRKPTADPTATPPSHRHRESAPCQSPVDSLTAWCPAGNRPRARRLAARIRATAERRALALLSGLWVAEGWPGLALWVVAGWPGPRAHLRICPGGAKPHSRATPPAHLSIRVMGELSAWVSWSSGIKKRTHRACAGEQ